MLCSVAGLVGITATVHVDKRGKLLTASHYSHDVNRSHVSTVDSSTTTVFVNTCVVSTELSVFCEEVHQC